MGENAYLSSSIAHQQEVLMQKVLAKMQPRP
jgi:hypothetical protein